MTPRLLISYVQGGSANTKCHAGVSIGMLPFPQPTIDVTIIMKSKLVYNYTTNPWFYFRAATRTTRFANPLGL